MYASIHFDFEQLAKGVYAAMATGTGGTVSNSGIVDLGDEVVIFDTCLTPQAAADLRTAAETLTGHPVRLAINSHYHADHVQGNQIFEDVEIYATALTQARITAPDRENILPQIKQTITELQEELQHLTDPEARRNCETRLAIQHILLEAGSIYRLQLPTKIFDTKVFFQGKQRSAQLLTYGGGHTDSDTILYLPADGIIFTADLFVNGVHPWLGEGHLQEWLNILDQILALEAQTFVPGHGPIGGRKELLSFRIYLKKVSELLHTAIGRGDSAEAVASSPIPPEYSALHSDEMWEINLRGLHKRLSKAQD